MSAEAMTDPLLELAQQTLRPLRAVVTPMRVSRGGRRLRTTKYRPILVLPGLEINMGSILAIERTRSRSLVSDFDVDLGRWKVRRC